MILKLVFCTVVGNTYQFELYDLKKQHRFDMRLLLPIEDYVLRDNNYQKDADYIIPRTWRLT